jgi:hypothetical protein
LILEVAYKLGVAFYGPNGDQEPQIPVDLHDLTLCKRIVNKAIRMFINDAPPNGWRWTKPIAEMDVWPQISPDSSVTPATGVKGTYSVGTNITRLTLFQVAGGTAAFYPSMEMRQIWLNGQPSSDTPGFVVPPNTPSAPIGTPFPVVNYVSATQVDVQGNAVAPLPNLATATGVSYSFASQGDFTMPANFGGQVAGEITYIANTNRGMILRWIDEATIRSRRQNYNIESGTPYECAVRLMPQPSVDVLNLVPPMKRRRWELMTWRIPSEFLHMIFPYILAFDNLTNLNDVPPSPFHHDETLKAACFAVAEKEVEDTIQGPDWSYYRTICLPNSYRVDAMSAPKVLGYFSNPTARGSTWPAIRDFRDNWYQRPTVGVGS